MILYFAFVWILYDFKNSKLSFDFLSKFLYKQFWFSIRNLLSRFSKNSRFISSIRHLIEIKTSNRFYKRNQFAKIWEINKNTHSTRTCICLNISQLFCIETISQLQENRSIKSSKLYTMRKRRIRKIFNNVWWFKQISKCFNVIELVHRSTRNEKWWKKFIQIKSVFVLTSQRFSSTKNFHVSKQIHHFHSNRFWKVWKSTKDTHINESCFCFYIFAFFSHREFHYQTIQRSSINSRIFYVFFFEIESIKMNLLNDQ